MVPQQSIYNQKLHCVLPLTYVLQVTDIYNENPDSCICPLACLACLLFSIFNILILTRMSNNLFLWLLPHHCYSQNSLFPVGEILQPLQSPAVLCSCLISLFSYAAHTLPESKLEIWTNKIQKDKIKINKHVFHFLK